MSVDNLIKSDMQHSMSRVASMDMSPDLKPQGEPVDNKPQFEQVETESIDGQGKAYDEVSHLPKNEDVDQQIEEQVHADDERQEDSQAPAQSEGEPDTSRQAQLDEYGNEIDTTPKTFSQDQVNEMMQERIDRIHKQYQGQQPEPQQNYEQPQQNFDAYQQQNQIQQQPQAEVAADDWEGQLNQYIDQRMQQKQTDVANHQRQQQEQRATAQHQEKFMQGAQRYQDFQDVVGSPKLNVTESMFTASRMMDDPASFFYAAAKHQPSELNRISAIPDQMMQAAEMARLDERMRRPKAAKTRAPAPMRQERGDMGHKKGTTALRSIDSRIQEHGNLLRSRSGN